MRWEYKTIKIATTGFSGGKLDETAFDTNQGYGATRDVVAVFKRPK